MPKRFAPKWFQPCPQRGAGSDNENWQQKGITDEKDYDKDHSALWETVTSSASTQESVVVLMKYFFYGLWLWGLVLLVPCLSAGAADLNGTRLSSQVLGNGDVVINEGPQEVARVHIIINTGNYSPETHQWDGTFTFKANTDDEKTSDVCTVVVNKVPIDLKYNVTQLEDGVHIHYSLIPRGNVSASRVRVVTSFPYKDWQGASFDFNGDNGAISNGPIPDNPEDHWIIREGEVSPLSLGPTDGGLTFKMETTGGLDLILGDDRWHDGTLSIALGHERYYSTPKSVWENGQSKDFDFTLSYNRPMESRSSDSGLSNKTGTGWKDCSSVLIDDFDDSGRNGIPPARANLWGGIWATVVLNGSIAVTYNGPGADSSRYSAGVTGIKGNGDAYSLFHSPLSSWDVPFDAACHGLVGVQFWFKGDGNAYRFQVPTKAVTEGGTVGDWYGVDFATSPGVWTLYKFPFKDLTRQTVLNGGQEELPDHPDGSDVTGIQFIPLNVGDFSYSVDQISFYGPCIPDCSNPGSSAPVQTPTITPTPLENDCLDRVIDDFDDPSRNGTPPNRVNRWGGKWNTTTASDSEINVSYTEPGDEGTRFCATLKGSNWQSDGDDAVYQTKLFTNGAPFNSVIHGLAGIQFLVKGDGNSYWFNLFSSSVTKSYTFNIVPPKDVWTLFNVPFKNMNLKSSVNGEDEHPDGSDVTGIGFEFRDRGSFIISVDQIAFYGNPSNCPHPKAPEEPTLVPKPSSTPTFTATYTFTPWPTATPIPTSTPRPTLVPFFNSRPSSTPTTLPIILSFSKPTFVPISTPTPRPRPKRIRLKPTPTWVWHPTMTATPVPIRTSTLKAAISTPTKVAPALLNLLDREQTIEFSVPPANIYVTFADGPGWYQLKIMDGQENLIKKIYDHHVIAESDAWVNWDGQDEKGHDLPPGRYFVVIYKDGTALKSLSVIRSPASP